MIRTAILVLVCAASLCAQTPSAPGHGWDVLAFLEGSWIANTRQPGGAGATAAGTYTFSQELNGHILARHSSTAACNGPADFDCEHGDLLYIYRDAPEQPLKAIYFDNEGHVLHYNVSTPTQSSALFLTDPALPGPQFRLLYELKDSVMSGKFQMRIPGRAEWTSYLEWSGTRKSGN